MKLLSLKKMLGWVVLLALVSGFFVPHELTMPVEGANEKSYHPKSFWYYPWGKSVTHKGVDIFAKEKTPVLAATKGFVLYTGILKKGGNVVVVLGPRWRLHYYAHLHEVKTSWLSWVKAGEIIGSVGTSGNAKGKPPHLHYAIATLLPYPWRIDGERQGWKKMFYLNPIEYMKPTPKS